MNRYEDPNGKEDEVRLVACVALLRFIEDQLRLIHNQSLEWLSTMRKLELLLDGMEKWLAEYEGKDEKSEG